MEAFARAARRKECSLLLKIVPILVSYESDNACLHLLEDKEFLGTNENFANVSIIILPVSPLHTE